MKSWFYLISSSVWMVACSASTGSEPLSQQGDAFSNGYCSAFVTELGSTNSSGYQDHRIGATVMSGLDIRINLLHSVFDFDEEQNRVFILSDVSIDNRGAEESDVTFSATYSLVPVTNGVGQPAWRWEGAGEILFSDDTSYQFKSENGPFAFSRTYHKNPLGLAQPFLLPALQDYASVNESLCAVASNYSASDYRRAVSGLVFDAEERLMRRWFDQYGPEATVIP